HGLLPFARDTRNLLVLKPGLPTYLAREDAEAFLASLAYALQRAIQILFQVEESEIAVARIGDKNERRILFWEAAEGGSGVWTRLMDEPGAIARVAAEALRLCHFNPDTGEDLAV